MDTGIGNRGPRLQSRAAWCHSVIHHIAGGNHSGAQRSNSTVLVEALAIEEHRLGVVDLQGQTNHMEVLSWRPAVLVGQDHKQSGCIVINALTPWLSLYISVGGRQHTHCQVPVLLVVFLASNGLYQHVPQSAATSGMVTACSGCLINTGCTVLGGGEPCRQGLT